MTDKAGTHVQVNSLNMYAQAHLSSLSEHVDNIIAQLSQIHIPVNSHKYT